VSAEVSGSAGFFSAGLGAGDFCAACSSEDGVICGVGGVLSWARLKIARKRQKKTNNGVNFRITASS
jgi:hypothetical protein